MSVFTSAQDRATIASYRISWRPFKHMKPFTDGEIARDCFIDAMESFILNDKSREKIVPKVKEIPLSNDSTTRPL